MTKNQLIIEKVIVTFFEAAIAYITVNQTDVSRNIKLVGTGALAAGLSAVYNVVRQSKPPTMTDKVPPVARTIEVAPTGLPPEANL